MIEIQSFVLADQKPRTRDSEDPEEHLRQWFDFGARGYLRSLIDDGILDFDTCYSAVLSKDPPLLKHVLSL